MASKFITVSKAFTSHNNNNLSSLSNQRPLGGCRNSVRVCAIAKEIEPTKVVPQADRVLIRLEKLPELPNVCIFVWVHFRTLMLRLVGRFGSDLKMEREEKTALGVLLPKSAVQFERHLMGEILAVGAEVEQVEAGKKVLFSDINAYEVDLGTDARHCFCNADDLLALVE